MTILFMHLVGCTILTVILIVEHAEITLVTTLSDVMVFEGLQDCTTGLMGMGAVRKATIFGEMEDLTKVACQFLRLHIEGAKAFDTWCVDEPTLRLAQGLRSIQRNHLRESRRVLSCIVGIRDLGCSEIDTRDQAIDQGRLTYPTIAAEKSNLPFKHRSQKVYALTCRSRDGLTGIADGLIETDHHLLIVLFLRGEKVGLVEDEDYRDAIGLSRSQEPVDKGSRGLGVIDSDHQESLIDISRNDMTLFGKVDTLADDIVPTVLNVSNKGCTFGICHNSDPITHSNRIRAADAFQTEIPLDLTINQLAIVRQDGVPAACILNDESLQL